MKKYLISKKIFNLVDVVALGLGALGLPLGDDDVLLLKLHAQAQDVAIYLHQTVPGHIGDERDEYGILIWI